MSSWLTGCRSKYWLLLWICASSAFSLPLTTNSKLSAYEIRRKCRPLVTIIRQQRSHDWPGPEVSSAANSATRGQHGAGSLRGTVQPAKWWLREDSLARNCRRQATRDDVAIGTIHHRDPGTQPSTPAQLAPHA